MLASTGLTAKQRVTLRRNGRDVEVSSFISPCDLLNPHIVDVEVEGGVDFSQAKRDPESGKLCVLEEKEVDTLLKKPILECTHRSDNRKMNILFELAYIACG